MDEDRFNIELRKFLKRSVSPPSARSSALLAMAR